MIQIKGICDRCGTELTLEIDEEQVQGATSETALVDLLKRLVLSNIFKRYQITGKILCTDCNDKAQQMISILNDIDKEAKKAFIRDASAVDIGSALTTCKNTLSGL